MCVLFLENYVSFQLSLRDLKDTNNWDQISCLFAIQNKIAFLSFSLYKILFKFILNR